MFVETLISAKWRRYGSWWTCFQSEAEKKGHRGKNKTFFSLSHTLCQPSRVSVFTPSRQCCVPQSAHVTRSWHNRPASFVSWAYSDMVHHDLSLDNMCWCHELSFVAGLFLKGAQSFQRALWPRLTLWFFVSVCVYMCDFVCMQRKLCKCHGICTVTHYCGKHPFSI